MATKRGLDYMTTQEQNEILSELNNFTGTEQYFKASNLYNLNLTDGINFLRNKLNCYWLIDIVGSVKHLKKIQENKSFILWRIVVNEDKSFIVRAYSDYENPITLANAKPFTEEQKHEHNKQYLLYEQKGKYTDFKLNEFEFYQQGEVLLLKSEY
jgi:hypothetical protein